MSAVERAADLWARPRLRLAVTVLAFAAMTLVTYLIAHPKMFTGFMSYDDEGYMLTALKGFVNHGQLYDDVFSQYGPFYYEFWGGIFSTFGIAVTHDAGRTATMVAWILSGLLLGLATTRITGSLLLGLATQVLAFSALYVLTNEPMHPVGIIALLLAAIVAVSCFVRERSSPYAIAVLGALVAALVLVKINVGFFAFVSVAFAAVLSYPLLSTRRWPRPLVEAVFVALPVLLMLGKFDEGWARHYALHVACAAAAVVLALRARQPRQRPNEELRWLLGGFLVLAAVVCLTIVAAGTSVGGLVDGVVRQPLRQADAFTIPMQISRRFYAIDVLALGAAAAYWYAGRRRAAEPGPTWVAVTSLFSIGVGIVIALSVSGKALPFDAGTIAGFQLSMLPFAWVALLAVPSRRPAVDFAALLLPLLAVLQGLHGYPVAGSQTLLSAFLMVPVGALCVGGGVRGLATVMPAGPDRRALAGFGAVAAVVLLWFVANGYLREPLDGARAAYDGGVPLALPGSHDIHLGEEEAQMYGKVTALIDRHCPAMVMLPGMDSFYLWSGQEPPSYTATGWETLFDTAHQQRVIDDTRGIAGLCLLRNRERAAGWGERPGPLVTYLEHGFAPVATVDGYELLQRRGAAR
ncbi:MAG TPA: hypothetical protein VHA54_03845 [Solirubrobacterales bacterium]|nr:hypothetical protein [Solirubrobacterales bacterium]